MDSSAHPDPHGDYIASLAASTVITFTTKCATAVMRTVAGLVHPNTRTGALSPPKQVAPCMWHAHHITRNMRQLGASGRTRLMMMVEDVSEMILNTAFSPIARKSTTCAIAAASLKPCLAP